MAEQTKVDQQKDQHAWQGKPVIAFIIRAFAFTSPIIASVIASIWLSRALPQPQSLGELVRWWAIILTGSTLVLFGVNWAARRLLPLAALMRLTMVFPDKAPRRFRTALKSGSSVRHLKAQIEEAERIGSSGDQDKAAEFILQLSNALNTHDRRTRGHAERVRAYAEMLAEEMDLNVEDKSKLRWASLLHDIGKLKISPDILNKPGRLNDEEWLEIKKHPSHGADICAPLLDWLGNFANTIEDHHERFDGNGYPNAKKGDEISIGGRIVSVADAYDVMTTVRSYKAAMPANAAREELARNAGGQFDPVVVRAFLNISMGRLRWVAGPLSWLAQLPFLRFVGAVQQVGTAVGVAGVTATGVAAVVGAGIVDVPGTEYLELPTVPGIQAAVVAGPSIDAANDSITAPEDSRVSFNPLANDSGTGVITIVDAPDFGRVVINEDGTVTYTPDDDYFGDDEFTYNLVGDEGETDTAAVTVTVTPVNDAPVAGDDTATTDEDTPVAIAVLANDSDVEGLDAASVVITAQGLNGFAVFDSASGLITYTPNPDFTGTDAFRYQVADTDGVVAEARVTVNVVPVNDEPVAEDDEATVDEDGSVVVDVAANDADPEGALDFDSLAVSIAPSDGTATVVGGALTYDPDDNFYGADSLTYEICDVEGLCDSASVAITVTAVNDAPTVPGPGAVTTDEDVSIDIDLMAGVGDIDGDDLTLTVDVASANGAAVVNHGDGTVTYWPPPDYYGADTFSFAVSDGIESVSFEVAVTVGEVNDAPVVPGPGLLLVTEDTMFSFDPVAGATDVDGDVVVLDSFDAVTAAGGTVTLGSLEYTPPTDFTGSDSFDYTLTDGRGAFVTVTVSLTVVAVNDAPVGVDDSYVTDEDVPLVVAAPGVLANDSDTEGAPLSAIPASVPTDGVLTMSGDGAFSYSPNPGFVGLDSFTYTVADGVGGTATATVSIDVQSVNDAPVAGDDAATTDEDTGVMVDLLGNDTDAEDGIPAGALSILSGPEDGSIVDNGDGTVTYTPDPDFNGSDGFTYTVDDSDGAISNVATVTITVDPANDAPVLDPIGPISSAELTLISFSAAGSDLDSGDSLTFSLVGAVPSAASINPATGVFAWTPTEADGPGVFIFDVVVTDDGTPVLADSQTITVTVSEANATPSLDPIGPQAGDELASIAFTAVASDSDLPANTLTFALAGAVPTGAFIHPATGAFSWTPTENQDGIYVFDVVVDDGALSASETITVTVNEVNLAPTLDPIGPKTIDEGLPVTFTATASDPDVVANSLTFSLVGAVPSGASINPTTGVFTWTPSEGHGPGAFVFDVVVTDNGVPLKSDSETITITVNEANNAPVADPAADVSVPEGSPIAFTATASDSDLPADTLTWSIVSGPGSITPGGAYSWAPGEVDGPGAYSVVLRVTDDGVPAMSDTEGLEITVSEVNQAPVLAPIGDKTVDEGTLVSFTAAASDTDLPVNTLTFALSSGAPPGASITPGGVFTWTPTEAQGPGSYVFDVLVADGGSPLLVDSETITVTVNEVNVAPVADAVADEVVDEGSPVALTATASDTDVPANGLAWSLIAGPGAVTPAGAYSWAPGEADGPGTYVVTLRVTDDGTPPLSDVVSFQITVNEVNVAPVADAIGGQTVDEGTLFTLSATGSDVDLPANGLTWSIVSGPGSITAGGAYSWTPTEADGPGVYAVIIAVTDDGVPPLSDPEGFSVTVDEANNAPVADPIADQNVDEGNLVSLTATATDTDVPANGLSWTLVSGPGAVTAGGAYSWTPTEADGPGSYPVTLRVTDDGTPNLSDDVSFRVIVSEVNTAPVTDAIADEVVDEGSLVSLTATATDADVPANGLAWSMVSGPGAITAGGAYSWTPGEADGPGTYVVTVRVTDDGTPNLSDDVSFQVTVNEVNVAPVADAIGDQTVDEGTLFTLTATASDTDLPANSLSWTIVSGPGAVTAGGAYSWTPTEADGPGAYPVILRVTDNGSPALSDTEGFSITVNEANQSPVLDPIGAKSGDEGTLITFTATATDPDLPADGLSLVISGAPAGASITAGGLFTWTPTEAQGPGVYSFNVIVSDDGAPVLNDFETISVTVGEVNLAPSITSPGDQSDGVGSSVSLAIVASDPDTPANTLSFSDGGTLPTGLGINPGTGVITGTPSAGGTYSVTITVTETNGVPTNLNDATTFDWTISNVPPVLISELRTEGPGGSADEFVELYNPNAGSVTIEGWVIKVDDGNLIHSFDITIDSNNDGAVTSAVIPGHGFYLLVNGSYSGGTAADQTFGSDVVKGAGLALYSGATEVDAVGTAANWKDGLGSLYKEGAPLAPMQGAVDHSYERQGGDGYGACVDTDDNASDFFHNFASSTPRNSASPPQPCGTPPPAGPPAPVGHVVISEFRFDGPNGGSDEFIELFNPTPLDIDIGGYELWVNDGVGTSAFVFPAFTLQSGRHVLLGGDGGGTDKFATPSATVPDFWYGGTVTNGSGVFLENDLDVVIDAVSTGGGPQFEGTALPVISGRVLQSYERLFGFPAGNCVDTNSNVDDFRHNIGTENPQNSSDPATPCPNSSGDIVINEVLYEERLATYEEFVEIYNGSSVSYDLTGWTLADGNLAAADVDAVNPLAYVFPASDDLARPSMLAPGEYAVVWLQSRGGDNIAPFAALEFDAGLGTNLALSPVADDVFLYDSGGQLTDYMTYGDSAAVGSEVNTVPADPWNDLYSAANAVAVPAFSGQSLSLTPDGIDSNHSACFEPAGTGLATVRPECAGSLATVAADQDSRDASPGLDNNGPYSKSPLWNQVVINEVLYNGSDEFVEIRNSTAGPVDLSGWTFADGNIVTGDYDGGGAAINYVFPGGSILPAGGHAVVWMEGSNPDRQASPYVDLQVWAGALNNVLQGSDDLWLWDGGLELVDYVAWGFAAGLSDPPTPLGSFWDDTFQMAMASAPNGVSISLTADGTDSDDSACWEFTTTGSSTCGVATVDNDDFGIRVASPGDDNNVATADLEVTKTVDDLSPTKGDSLVYTITVINNSRSNAVGGVELTDELPNKITYVSDDSLGAYDDATGVWDVGIVPANSSRVLNIDVIVTANPGQDVVNSAALTAAAVPDPDASNNSDSVTLTINRPPDAVNDATTVYQDLPATIAVLGNDSDPEGDSFTITAWDPLSTRGGTVDCSSGTSCDYISALGFASSPNDSFTYTVTDTKGASATATVTVTVTPLASSPLFLKTDGTTNRDVLLSLAEAPYAPTHPGSPVPDWNDDGDGKPGMKLQRSSVSPYADETSDSKMQTWAFTVTDPAGLTIDGQVVVRVWSASKDFDNLKAGVLQARLSVCPAAASRDSNTCAHLGVVAEVDSGAAPWAPSGNFEMKLLDFGAVGPVVVAQGDQVRIKIVVPDTSDGDLWIAFDTHQTPSVLLFL